jgi:transcriptional regulator with XRE-family HTH domain
MDLNAIIREIKKRGITAYKIAEDTELTEVGINKILNGSSKTPRKKTLDILHNYLQNNYVKERHVPEIALSKSSAEYNKEINVDFLKRELIFKDKMIDLYKEKVEFYEKKFIGNEIEKRLLELEEFKEAIILKLKLDLAIQETEDEIIKKNKSESITAEHK